MKALAIFKRRRESVCYEVRLEIDTAIVGDYDEWLLGHVREMLAFPGFQSATVYRAADLAGNNRAVRVVTYEVRSHRELDSYLRTHASRMRREGVARFGKQFSASRRIVPAPEYTAPANLAVLYDQQDISGGLPICGNCHQPVSGRYCANCGQEDRTYLLSLKELLSDFFGELTNFDSRFFRSMGPLLFKPGWLTLEYMRGRRQHYFPPIRMYIIISLLFFFFTALVADSGLEDSDFGNNVVVEGEPGSPEGRRDEIRELEQQMENATGIERRALEIALHELREQEGADGTESTPVTEDEVADGNASDSNAAEDEPAQRRDDTNYYDWKLSDWTTGWTGESLELRLERGSEAIQNNPRAFVRALIDNIPPMMLIFLPLIALMLKILYVFSGRYYIEHLMFSLHVHSAVFLILLFWMLLRELAVAWPTVSGVMGWISAIIWIYIPVYLYKSMRRVYGQGHFMTSIKFFLLSICYTIAASITSVFLVVAAVYQQA